jgi:SprB repeat
MRFLITLAVLLVGYSTTSACGYNFVSGCSSEVYLRINNTLDSFAVGLCPDEKAFQGLQLGKIRTLFFAGARSTTWESCINNVTDITFFYRVYEQGGGVPAWKNLQLPEIRVITQGPYTTRYRSKFVNTDLTTGLTAGKRYVMEVYYRAEVDTLGDDFRPETFILQNNDGQYYRATFEYAGASAPPFSLVMTQRRDVRCYGDSTGKAEVVAYGGTNLTYEWTVPFPLNFPLQTRLPAGRYKIKVRNNTGYADSILFQINQPLPIFTTLSNIVPVTCNAPGRANTNANGGVPPYTYQWNTPDKSPVFPTRGPYTMTVTDGNNCSKQQTFTISGDTVISLSQNVSICTGETYRRGGQTLSTSGDYTLLLPTPGGCDTTLRLSLLVLNPNRVLETIPDTIIRLTCNARSANICARNAPFTDFIWRKDGAVIGRTFCQTLTQAGSYDLQVQQIGATKQCNAGKRVAVQAFFNTQFRFSAQIQHTTAANLPNGSIRLQPSGGPRPFSFRWRNNSIDSVLLNLLPGDYCVTITDGNGCSRDSCIRVSILSGVNTPEILPIALSPNPVASSGTLYIKLPEIARNIPAHITIFDVAGNKIRQLNFDGNANPSVDFSGQPLPPGMYMLQWEGEKKFRGKFVIF